VTVSAKAVYSKYSIYPASLINFGAVINGTKKTCPLLLENKGFLDFKYVIYKVDKDAHILQRKRGAQGGAVKHQPLLGLFLQTRISLGMFTVYPGFGTIPAGGRQMVTVDCHAEHLGTCKEQLSIDISDR
ncbi:HYDIN protein, partial [Todus mexicanus]|nr:HYDIN protein [Todus mexicanus]